MYLVEPVKLFASLIYRDEPVRAELKELLIRRWGAIDYETQPQPFTSEEKIQKEMGAPLFRSLISFQRLIDPGEIANIKAACLGLEEKLRHQGVRRMKLDVGYLDSSKVVLSSRTGGGQKIYHSSGFYLELALLFAKEKCQALPWSEADFKNHFYDDDFLAMWRLHQTDPLVKN